MSRFAVGDLQGCLTPLQALLSKCAFDPARDELWLVGDLVNRGPDSLETLRFLYGLRDSLRITLGNHDLHCLALARGATDRGRHPSLAALLAAPDCKSLMEWLRQQPLVYRDPRGDYIMSHAGVPAIWSSDKALALGGEVQAILQSDNVDDFLANMYGNEPVRWWDELIGLPRYRCITNYLTRMRLCAADGSLELTYKGDGKNLPEGFRPWFDWQRPGSRRETQIFGHWAALQGRTRRSDIIGLDSGCVWGNCLTMLNLENGELLTQPCGAG